MIDWPNLVAVICVLSLLLYVVSAVCELWVPVTRKGRWLWLIHETLYWSRRWQHASMPDRAFLAGVAGAVLHRLTEIERPAMAQGHQSALDELCRQFELPLSANAQFMAGFSAGLLAYTGPMPRYAVGYLHRRHKGAVGLKLILGVGH